MQITSRRASNSWAQIALLGLGALVVLALAVAVAFDKSTIALLVCAVALAPVFVYIAARWPTIFPFGVYAISVPFDPLLKASNGTGSTVTKFIGLITIVALLVHAYRLRRLDAPPTSWFFWLAFMIWAAAGLLWSIVPEETIGTLQIVGSLFALYSVAAIYPISIRDYVYARRGIVLAGVFTAAYGFYAYASGQRLGKARLSLQSGDLSIDPNHYAAFFSIPIAILVARFFCTTSVRERFVTAILALAMLVNVLLTGSRGGLIASVIVIIYLGFRARKFALLGISLVSSTILSFAIPNVWARVFDSTLQDASGRNEIWNTGLVGISHYGLFGAGFGTFSYVYDDMMHNSVQRSFAGFHRPAHNILIQTAVDLGILGIAFLLSAWAASVAQNRKIARASLFFADAIACEGAMIGIFVSALTIDLLWFKYLWLALCMVVMLSNATNPRLLLGRVRPQPRIAAKTP